MKIESITGEGYDCDECANDNKAADVHIDLTTSEFFLCTQCFKRLHNAHDEFLRYGVYPTP